jgi:hypothetical protein
MIRDRRVLEAIDSSGERGCTLHMYLTQNPCHFSSSNSTESCVEKLLLYRRDHLAPRHAALRIHATYPYRAHWDEAHMSEDDLAGARAPQPRVRAPCPSAPPAPQQRRRALTTRAPLARQGSGGARGETRADSAVRAVCFSPRARGPAPANAGRPPPPRPPLAPGPPNPNRSRLPRAPCLTPRAWAQGGAPRAVRTSGARQSHARGGCWRTRGRARGGLWRAATPGCRSTRSRQRTGRSCSRAVRRASRTPTPLVLRPSTQRLRRCASGSTLSPARCRPAS